MTWIADHFTWVLLAVLLMSLWSTAKNVRRLAALAAVQPRPTGRLVGTVVATLISLGLMVVSGLGVIQTGPASWRQNQALGKPAPDLAYQRLADDSPASLADHAGKVVVVNFWATWCPPCIEEMPDFQRFQESFADRGVVVLQISDEKPETVRSFLAERPMTTTHGTVEEIPWPSFGLPTTYLVDRQGVVRWTITRMTRYEELEKEVTPLLGP